MKKVNEHNLLESLKKLALDGKVQRETNQIYVIIKHDGKEFPLFMRMLHEGELIQLLTFIPCYVEADKINDLGRFLHMLNKELDMPGFCFDENSKTIFYRLILPALKKEYAEETLEAYLNTSQMIVKTFGTAVEALAVGAMTLDQILQKAHELQAAAKGK